ncbi:hypothetical protein AMJ40_00300 [candidate division TA06 bacterium DG_26]|uniref:DUF5320 domain-containing protein n=1 Tax=candidate division TA06 bacterium DG_26 TaxID=1703771 RepID=A0A0S7WMA7_UNCT6|nr:MAG: hypothetical protein AMJ40_00300 [candidate division TA06 bacterium DG_26]
MVRGTPQVCMDGVQATVVMRLGRCTALAEEGEILFRFAGTSRGSPGGGGCTILMEQHPMGLRMRGRPPIPWDTGTHTIPQAISRPMGIQDMEAGTRVWLSRQYQQPSLRERDRGCFRKEVSRMPFGMGRAGWFMWPYFAQWVGYWYPFVPYIGPHSYATFPYASSYPYAPMAKEEEVAYLQEQAKMVKQEYDRISSRLKELQKAK